MLSGSTMLPARQSSSSPLIDRDCPDPGVVELADGWLLASTSGRREDALDLWRSPDLRRWQRVGAIFPHGSWPGWAAGDFWAPEPALIGGRLHCWYTARDQGGRLCIGLAWQEDGRWRDHGRPFLRREDLGLIDPALLRAPDGRLILLWKEDGNDCRPQRPCRILAQELAADGRTVLGQASVIAVNDRAWEGDVVEAPCLIHRDGWYVLFYSGHGFGGAAYATGVARSRSPFGPFVKRDEPILVSSATWKGPGHGTVATVGGSDWFLYHAWRADQVGAPHPRRLLRAAIAWQDGWPRLGPLSG